MEQGAHEQLWTRTDDQTTFEICCLPYFTYGLALGDEIAWSAIDRLALVSRRSGRRLIRCAYASRADAS